MCVIRVRDCGTHVIVVCRASRMTALEPMCLRRALNERSIDAVWLSNATLAPPLDLVPPVYTTPSSYSSSDMSRTADRDRSLASFSPKASVAMRATRLLSMLAPRC